jgi:flagellar biosynthesis protein FlhG
LVVNRAQNILEGEQTAKKLVTVSKHFLKFELNNLGVIIDDQNVSSAVKKQKPFLLFYPNTIASRCINEIALTLTGLENQNKPSQGVQGFFSKIVKLLR